MKARLKVRLWIVNIFRGILALTMLASGLVKLLDPMGMVYKLQAYAEHWAFSIDDLWLKVAAVALGIIELQLGAYLLLGIRRRTSAWVALLMMVAFLGISAYLYFDGGISDCGCFGAAVELSSGATLLKNVLLTGMAFYVVCFPNRMRRLVTERNQGMATIYVFCYGLVLSLYSLHYLPLVTFTDYRKGESWATQYNDGTAPAREGVINLAVYNKGGEDVTAELLSDTSRTFILTLHDALKADDSSADRINDLYDFAVDHGYRFVALTGEAVNYANWQDRTGASYDCLYADADVIKAMVRSNPGLLLLHNGTLEGKWGTNNLPNVEEMNLATMELPESEYMAWTRILLLLIVPMLLLMVLDGVWIGRKYRGHRLRMRELLKGEVKSDATEK